MEAVKNKTTNGLGILGRGVAQVTSGEAVIPSADELVQHARDMIPMLREKADAIEQARRVDHEVIATFKKAGFFKILQPKQWGGYGMDPVIFMRVLMEIGRGCCSSGWNLMILGVHQWEFGHLPQQACADMWAKDNEILIASSYAPFGTAKKVDGGWALNGTWGTSSGTDHAEGGAFIGARVFDAQGRFLDHRSFLVARSDYEQIDDWYTMGLCGTGSKSVKLKQDTFVPDYRSHSIVDYKPKPEMPVEYWYPFNQIFFGAVSSAIVGFAQGMIDHFIEQTKKRQGIFVPGAIALSPYVKDRLGNAVALVRSSRARLLQIMAETREIVERNQLVPDELRVQQMLDIARVGRECEQAVLLLHKANSARGIYRSNPMQRILRDVLVAANHATQNADDNAGFLGGFLLDQGLPPGMYELPEYST